MTSHQVFGAIAPGLSLEIVESAFANDKKLYKAVVDGAAQLRRVRPIFLERQPRQERHLGLIVALGRPQMAMLADNLLRAWLIQKHHTMLVEFMEALGISHEKGIVENVPETIEEGVLRKAVETLLGKYPADAVAIYLAAFNHMNQSNWTNLEELLRQDPRLQIGKQEPNPGAGSAS